MKLYYIAIALVLLTACTGITGQVTSEPIKIGWIGAMTGPKAALGVDAAVAAQMAVDDINAQGGINGRSVELLIEDDEYNTVNTISAYHKLKGEGVQVIIMSTYGAIFALSEQAHADEIIIIDTLDCDRQLAELGPYLFCVAPTTEDKSHAIAKQITVLNMSKVGILANNGDTFMPTVGSLIAGELEQGSTFTEYYSPATRDFRTALLKMQSAGVDSIVFLGNDEIGIAMKQAREIGFNGPYFGTGAVTSPRMQAASQQTSEGTYFGYWEAPADRKEYTEFTKRFVEKQGRKPIIEFVTASTYDAVGIVALAYTNAKSTNDLAASFAVIRDYRGISADITFDDVGAASLPITIHQLQNGTAVAIE